MSDAPSSAPDAKAPKAAKGIKGALGKKVGPLPVGVWILAFGGGLAIAAVVRRRAVANAGEAAAVEEAGRWGWNEPDPGGTTPGVGGNAGNNGNTGGNGVPDVPDVPDVPEVPDLPPYVVIDWWPPPGFPPIPEDPQPPLPPVIEQPPLPPWQDPQEPSVPGTGGGGGDDLNNGGPTGITRHRYVARSAVDRHCRVCGKWQNTALHINREPERPKPPVIHGGGNGGGGNTGHDNAPHKWVRTSLTNAACKRCGRPRNSGLHTNPSVPKPPPRPPKPQHPGGATGHPVGGGGNGGGHNGGGGGGGNNGGGGHGATGGLSSTGVGPADRPHRYKAISANNKHCEVCNRWRDTWVHTNRNG